MTVGAVTEDRIAPMMVEDDTAAIRTRLAHGYAVRPAGLPGDGATDPRGDRAAIEAEAIRDVLHRHRVAGRAEAAIVHKAVGDASVGRRPTR